MGVKTLYWGPHAWIMLHSIAPYLGSNAVQFWIMLSETVPCVHCRASLKQFINQLYATTTDQTDLAYQIHEQVNLKLFHQDVCAADTDSAIEAVLEKWAGYQPSAPVAEPIKSEAFVHALFFFLSYMVCDIDGGRLGHVRTFIRIVLRDILKYGHLDYVGADLASPKMCDRVNYICRLEKKVRQRLQLGPSSINRLAVCRAALVKCSPS